MGIFAGDSGVYRHASACRDPAGTRRVAAETANAPRVAWLLITEIVALYVHNLAVPLTAWLVIAVSVGFLWQRDWRRLGTWLIAQVGLGIAYLPWLITQRPTGTPLNTPPELNPTVVWNVWQSYFTGIKTLVSADTLLMQITALFGVICLIGVLALFWKPSRRTWFVLSQAMLIPAFELAIILAAHIDFHPRYFIVGVPATLMLTAAGLESIGRRRVIRPAIRAVHPLALGGAALCATAIMIRAAQVTYSSPIYQHDDFRAIAQHYATLSANDAIIIPYGWEPTLDYYSGKMNFQARFINVPLHADGQTLIDTLSTQLASVHRAEVLTWYQLPADVRGAYPCILGALGHSAEGGLTVEGLKTDAYDSFTIRPFEAINLPAGNPQLDTLFMDGNPRALWGTNQVCVITGWQTQHNSDLDMRLAMRLQLGWETIKADTQILNNAQLPVPLWRGGEITDAFSAFSVPDAVPAATFPLTLSVYSPQIPQTISATLQITHDTANSLSLPPITAQDREIAPGAYLHAAILPTEDHLQQGQMVNVRLEWWRTPSPAPNVPTMPVIRVALEGSGWQAFDQAAPSPISGKLLTWHSLRIPASASGHVELKALWDDHALVLGTYTINAIPRTFDAPTLSAANCMAADFVGVGTLSGFMLPTGAIPTRDPFPVTLIWRADLTPSTDYTVFIHLLDANGQVIAQNDAPPAAGNRRTTDWLSGEYITDTHTLTFSRGGYQGMATLEVGLYDPANGQRVVLASGADQAVLPVSVRVQ